jgi:hypothetical protein
MIASQFATIAGPPDLAVHVTIDDHLGGVTYVCVNDSNRVERVLGEDDSEPLDGCQASAACGRGDGWR